MPYTTGAIYNPSTGSTAAGQILVICINDSINLTASIELEVFQWGITDGPRTPLGHNLIALPPQAIQSFTYPINAGGFYEVQVDYFSATSAVIHVFGLDAVGGVVQRVLQAEMSQIDRLTNLP
ncbi:hypothetical protein EJP77_14480 [Paenibacillus zeisoli]|uniref:Uncharacterized protein n=1 Tax=Paenibacillus zeisoli TaxID=2496267 RepID=A0A3S1BRE4_9BACL|nr:hypothetical protein [Paenibacillus zeisoli]RUT29581.1 hypothetical protein EJP77_14480 [Paenibacillus zeisoli]